MKEKSSIREKSRLLRSRLSEETVRENSRCICNKLLESLWYSEAEEILLYAPVQNEVDLLIFAEICLRDKKRIFFPKVLGEEMEFYHVQSLEELSEGAFHVPEPLETCQRWEERPCKLPVRILVPGVAFNRKGMRIGYGKGFYDRYLSHHPGLFPIGIAHDVQIFPAWMQEMHDWRMKQIITEKREVMIVESGDFM